MRFLPALLAAFCVACTTTSLTTPGQSVVKCQVTLTGPSAAVAPEGGEATVGVAAAPECPWSATTETAWISDLAPTSGQGNANLRFKTSANPAAAARQGDISVNGTAVRISQSPAPCTYDVVPRSVTSGADGGPGSVTVTTLAGCTWTAASEVSWVTVTSARENTNSGSVAFTVATNTDIARIGSMTIAGVSVLVSQAARNCTFVLGPATQTIAAAGGPGQITVTAPTGCAWTATADVPWITFSSGATGTSNGTVSLVAAPNTSASARTGRVTIGTETVTVVQSGTAPVPPACSFSIAPTTQAFGDIGGSGSVTVTAPATCAWTASSNASWLAVTSGTNGTGPGTVSFSVAVNSGSARSGTLLIAGQTFTVNQAAPAAPQCTFMVAPLNQSIGAAGGAATQLTVTTTSTCAWTAVSSDAWIQVTSGASLTGSGTVQLTVSANTGAARTGRLTVAGQQVTIDQAAAPCAFNVAPLTQTINALGGPGTSITVTVTAGVSCMWTAVANDGWIHVASGSPGSGSGTVQLTIDANLGASRGGTLTIAGQTVTVNQDAAIAPCSYAINPTAETVGNAGGTGTSVAVTTQSLCMWTALSNASWIHVASGASGTGNGSVGWTFDANTGAQRSGTMTIAGQTFTATQDAVCSYSINPTSASFTVLGGINNTVTVTTQGTCGWTATTADSWITINSGTPGAGSGSITYSVAINLLGPRSGSITIAGQTFTVDQQ